MKSLSNRRGLINKTMEYLRKKKNAKDLNELFFEKAEMFKPDVCLLMMLLFSSAHRNM